MLDIQQKRKLRNVMYHKFTLGALGVLTLLFAHSTWGVYEKKKESEALMVSSEENLKKLEERNEILSYKIERLDTQTGLEEEIRSRFSVVKENESMVIVVQDGENATSSEEKPQSFWQKIKNLFSKE